MNKAYLTNLAAALTGQQGFTNQGVTEMNALYATSMTVVMFYMIFIVLSGAGAAYLSYNYNIYIGNSSGTAMAFAVLNFFFSMFYYPYYALFLDPLGKRRR
jgi:hypothetical protein